MLGKITSEVISDQNQNHWPINDIKPDKWSSLPRRRNSVGSYRDNSQQTSKQEFDDNFIDDKLHD